MAYTFPDFWTLWPRQILCMNKYIPLLRAWSAYPLWKANLIVDGMIETIWWLSWLVIRWDKLESVFDYQTCLAPHTTTSNQPTLPPQPAAKLNKLEWEQFISNLEQNLTNSMSPTSQTEIFMLKLRTRTMCSGTWLPKCSLKIIPGIVKSSTTSKHISYLDSVTYFQRENLAKTSFI